MAADEPVASRSASESGPPFIPLGDPRLSNLRETAAHFDPSWLPAESVELAVCFCAVPPSTTMPVADKVTHGARGAQE